VEWFLEDTAVAALGHSVAVLGAASEDLVVLPMGKRAGRLEGYRGEPFGSHPADAAFG